MLTARRVLHRVFIGSFPTPLFEPPRWLVTLPTRRPPLKWRSGARFMLSRGASLRSMRVKDRLTSGAKAAPSIPSSWRRLMRIGANSKPCGNHRAANELPMRSSRSSSRPVHCFPGEQRQTSPFSSGNGARLRRPARIRCGSRGSNQRFVKRFKRYSRSLGQSKFALTRNITRGGGPTLSGPCC